MGKSDKTNGYSWRIPKSTSFFEEGKPIKDELVQFDTWTDWENQCAHSRLWGGMHFKDAVEDGLKLGRQFAADAINFVNNKINPMKEKISPMVPVQGCLYIRLTQTINLVSRLPALNLFCSQRKQQFHSKCS